ncbi:unnamed protein product, partial [Closterium sp. NIES-54]
GRKVQVKYALDGTKEKNAFAQAQAQLQQQQQLAAALTGVALQNPLAFSPYAFPGGLPASAFGSAGLQGMGFPTAAAGAVGGAAAGGQSPGQQNQAAAAAAAAQQYVSSLGAAASGAGAAGGAAGTGGVQVSYGREDGSKDIDGGDKPGGDKPAELAQMGGSNERNGDGGKARTSTTSSSLSEVGEQNEGMEREENREEFEISGDGASNEEADEQEEGEGKWEGEEEGEINQDGEEGNVFESVLRQIDAWEGKNSAQRERQGDIRGRQGRKSTGLRDKKCQKRAQQQEIMRVHEIMKPTQWRCIARLMQFLRIKKAAAGGFTNATAAAGWSANATAAAGRTSKATTAAVRPESTTAAAGRSADATGGTGRSANATGGIVGPSKGTASHAAANTAPETIKGSKLEKGRKLQERRRLQDEWTVDDSNLVASIVPLGGPSATRLGHLRIFVATDTDTVRSKVVEFLRPFGEVYFSVSPPMHLSKGVGNYLATLADFALLSKGAVLVSFTRFTSSFSFFAGLLGNGTIVNNPAVDHTCSFVVEHMGELWP